MIMFVDLLVVSAKLKSKWKAA